MGHGIMRGPYRNGHYMAYPAGDETGISAGDMVYNSRCNRRGRNLRVAHRVKQTSFQVAVVVVCHNNHPVDDYRSFLSDFMTDKR